MNIPTWPNSWYLLIPSAVSSVHMFFCALALHSPFLQDVTKTESIINLLHHICSQEPDFKKNIYTFQTLDNTTMLDYHCIRGDIDLDFINQSSKIIGVTQTINYTWRRKDNYLYMNPMHFNCVQVKVIQT